MNSGDRLDRIEAILAATAVQQQANTEALTRLEAQTFANSEAIGRRKFKLLPTRQPSIG